MQIMVQNRQRRHPAPLKLIRKTTQKILNVLGYPDDTGISITIVGDQAIRRLNREYLQKDHPTNVISFSMQEGEFAELAGNLLGDVVISADTAAREGETSGIDAYQRLVFLLLHGVLHLAGYDHERSGEDEAQRMMQKEAEIWEILQQDGLTILKTS